VGLIGYTCTALPRQHGIAVRGHAIECIQRIQQIILLTGMTVGFGFRYDWSSGGGGRGGDGGRNRARETLNLEAQSYSESNS